MLEQVLYWFEKIAEIPHGSGNTKGVSDFCVSFAKERGLEVYQDDHNNVVIKKPGNREADPIILQGHLDMVCEKEPGVEFDFEKDSLRLIYDGDFLTADGTTLGGDDGIAVAMCLAILDADNLTHPDLEVVFTTDEETGMFGAHALDTSLLKAKRLLNIDSENEGVLTVGCAGGARAEITLPYNPSKVTLVSRLEELHRDGKTLHRRFFSATCTGEANKEKDYCQGSPVQGELAPQATEGLSVEDNYLVAVTGLMGGHSGVEIDKGRLNANKVMGEFLQCLIDNDYSVRLYDMEGGKADNVIPSEAKAVIHASYEGDLERHESVESLAALFVKEHFTETDPGLVIAIDSADALDKTCRDALGKTDTERVIELITTLPNGIQKMSEDVPGLPETSLNLGQMWMDESGFKVRFSVRSSVTAEKEKLLKRLSDITKDFDGMFETDGNYPAWEFVKESSFRDGVVDVYKGLYGREPVIEIIHAGLECGLFSEKMPGLDAISIGPDLFDIHTPKERLNLKSAERTMEFVLKILEEV